MHKGQDASWLSNRSLATQKLHENPYNIKKYLIRAICHENLGYLDLSAGDAYRALLLIDEVEFGEYQEQVCESLLSTRPAIDSVDESSNGVAFSQKEWLQSTVKGLAVEAYSIIVRALEGCGDVSSALSFMERGLKAFPDECTLQMSYKKFQNSRHSDSNKATLTLPANGECSNDIAAMRQEAFVRREIYPWNDHEPDRFSEDNLAFLNTELQKCAPKCEVRVTNLPLLSSSNVAENGCNGHLGHKKSSIKQLGIFANQGIAPSERVLLEPSILTASNRLLEPLCDACSAPLPPLSPSNPLPSCSGCSDIYFCSETCHDRAQQLYHPAICGMEDFDVVAKDPSPAAATDSLYLLLVIRAIAMAETQDKHPLDLPHISFLWGDFTSSSAPVERRLPFNFQTNIANPIQIMINMNINPFASSTLERYDIWVLNTLFAKFRGVASAKMNLQTLRPDVAAVHPLWCLANHSCAPNVRWEWGAEKSTLDHAEKGAIGFVARSKDELVDWGPNDNKVGIEKGDEVLNHYCDLDLTVRERREWAVGALGGFCQCERCVWEEGKGKHGECMCMTAGNGRYSNRS